MELETFLQIEDRDRLVWIAESSLHVKNHPGFFLWSQGALQMLIPHEILICGVRNGSTRSFQMRRFSSCRYFRDENFELICDPQNGLLSRVVSQWMRAGEPCFLLPGTDDETDKLLLDSELKNMVIHGVLGSDAEVSGYFCFSRTTARPDQRTSRILEVLIPIVYVTFLRVLSSDAKTAESGVRMNNLVTRREVEILGWIKEGKTTSDIAGILALSPFTVKNHVQNILKKLGARSRSHAVAQAMNLGLLHNGTR
ncbi:MAG: transcriptional regulator EpsA [Prolixibacteraceae bacterium]|nr:transcriptional regulator EpsA [Burkholderiales bacterium]